MRSPDIAIIEALRRDVAYQIARHARNLGTNQLAAAKQLCVPQPTLSKIMNGRVSDLSLELLIRISVRARLPMTLHTGRAPEEAGAFVARTRPLVSRAQHSSLSDGAREALIESERRLTPTQRLEAFLEHNQLLGQLHAAGRKAQRQQPRLNAQPNG
jgi:predicted XRE-type DNA-binding protein